VILFAEDQLRSSDQSACIVRQQQYIARSQSTQLQLQMMLLVLVAASVASS